MDWWVERYAGVWENAAGNCLHIEPVSDGSVSVDFLGPAGQAIPRPWCNGMPSLGMEGRYQADRGLIVELWERGKGFTLEVCHEAAYPLLAGPVEALTVGVSRNSRDEFLAQYVAVFCPLTHFTRRTNEHREHSIASGTPR